MAAVNMPPEPAASRLPEGDESSRCLIARFGLDAPDKPPGHGRTAVCCLAFRTPSDKMVTEACDTHLFIIAQKI